MKTKAAAFGIVCVTALGCGGGSGEIGLDQLPSARAQAVCAQNFKCSSAADLTDEADNMGNPITQQQCVNNIRTTWSLNVSEISDGQAKGRVVYDQAKAGACIAAIKAMSCEDWNSGLKQPPECPQAFVAKVAAGGKCASDFECIAGVCVGADSSTTPPTEGTCQTRAAAGAACSSSITDLFSNSCVDGYYCAGDACVPKKTGGVACGGDNECGSDNCNTTIGQCSGYVECSVTGPATVKSTLLSVLGLVLLIGGARTRARARRAR